MSKRLAAGLIFLLCIEPANAHPHVWMTIRGDVIFAADGSVTALRYSWSFDEMTSAFAALSAREDLAAQTALKAFYQSEFFTSVRANGTKQPFDLPVDCRLELAQGIATLHFTLPFKSPVPARTLELDVYDPVYFVDISFAEKAPVALVNAPGGCTVVITRQSWAQTANRVVINCE